jgi:hypothetical protein
LFLVISAAAFTLKHTTTNQWIDIPSDFEFCTGAIGHAISRTFSYATFKNYSSNDQLQDSMS